MTEYNAEFAQNFLIDLCLQVKIDLFDAVKKTAFVLGTALIIFASARNSITW